MKKEEVLAMVMAGGKGERLYPLTLDRTKPSVPFGGKYRIIDFALSNIINSGIYSIYVLVQYKSQSLIEHIRTTWIKEGILSKHFITVVPPQMRREKEWYKGTADSIYQNINLIYDFRPRFVAIFGGDHIYRMDIKDMIDYHLRKKADVTVAVIPIPSREAEQFGIVDTNEQGMVKNFREKPRLAGNDIVFASMGNYIFNTRFLIDTLLRDAKLDTAHDFGKDVLPSLVRRKEKIFTYDFSKNRIPSLKKYEPKYYWRDVGTIAAYWEANMDLLGKEPRFNLDNPDWPIYASSLNYPPAYTINSRIDDTLVSEGTKVQGAKIKHSILGRGVFIEDGCLIENSIIMDFTRIHKGCAIKNTIIDRFNTIPRDTKIGYDKKEDNKKYYLDSSDIVVAKRGERLAFYF